MADSKPENPGLLLQRGHVVNTITLHGYATSSLSIHPGMDTEAVSISLTIVNNVAMNVGVQIYF